MRQTRMEAMFNANSIFPTLLALSRRVRRGPWRWSVTVRRAPFRGYADLFHETFDDAATARYRADEVAELIGAGTRPWSLTPEN